MEPFSELNELVGYNPQNPTVKNYTDYLKVELKTVPDLLKRETRMQEVKEEPYFDDFDDYDDHDDDYNDVDDDDYRDGDYEEERQPVVIDVKPKKKKKAKKKKESSSLSIKEVKKKEPKEPKPKKEPKPPLNLPPPSTPVPTTGSSVVWRHFRIIGEDGNGLRQVVCHKIGVIFIWTNGHSNV